MPLKFAANISMLFREVDEMSARYEAARKAGFEAVECIYPYLEGTPEKLGQAREAAGVQHVLINTYPGVYFDQKSKF